MIVRRRAPWRVVWDFLRAWFSTSDTRLPELPVASASAFERSIAQEIARCQRRPGLLEFGVVRLPFDWRQHVAAAHRLVRLLNERLRITDELGWWDDTLSVLLPDTDRAGTHVVANWIEESGRELGLTIDSEIVMYPWDDAVGGKTREIWETAPSKVLANPPHYPPEGARADHALRGAALPAICRPIDSMPYWKRLTDLVGAGLGLVLLAPVFVVLAILIKRDSKGPALFVQWREGHRGKPFRMVKFRTMHHGAEAQQPELRWLNEQDGPAFKLTDDPRVTSVGRWLRRTGLDELPQLWNVLRGEMSLVGPRPLPISESERCELWQRRRLYLVPGITGLWQTSGRRDLPFEQWMRMDMEYLRRMGWWLDMKLLCATVWMAVRRRASV